MFASIHFQMIWLSFGLFLCYALIIWLSILFNPFFQMLKKICLHENIVSFVFVFEFHESPEKHCSIWGSWRKNLPCRPRSTRKNTLVPCLVRNLLGQFWRKKNLTASIEHIVFLEIQLALPFLSFLLMLQFRFWVVKAVC